MLDLLRAVVTDGTGARRPSTGLDIVGKTGTSQESRDAWFIGFAQGQGVVIGVWVGNDDNSPMDRVTGGGIPARIFREVMLAAVARQGPTAGTAWPGRPRPRPRPRRAPDAGRAAPCDIRACSAAYRSFDAATAPTSPGKGPRRLCTR
jgi:membrane peptidoglycan carboxypeptidase